ncbi:MAG: response regulator, partial [Oscillospiraceae bacterium]|nr:response regulator [Oscillospiraceae bacterium]
KSSRQGYYQLILMDIQMPVKNGLEATVEIRQSGRPDAAEIPIVAMTANSFKEDVENAYAAGMNAFVPKPVDIGSLYETIEHLIIKKETT